MVQLALIVTASLALPVLCRPGLAAESAPAAAAAAAATGKVEAVVSVVPAADGTLVINLKDAARIEAPFVKEEDSTAAQGFAIAVPPKSPKVPGAVELSFIMPKNGVYTVWVRAFWSTDKEEACSNSVQLQLGKAKPLMVTDATYGAWHWVQARFQNREHPYAVELEAGTNQVVLANREKGYKIDQLFITPWNKDESQRRVPQGIE